LHTDPLQELLRIVHDYAGFSGLIAKKADERPRASAIMTAKERKFVQELRRLVNMQTHPRKSPLKTLRL
jgi:hypothetical protein